MGSEFRKDFPILQKTIIDGKPLVYLDNAATTQKPYSVINAVKHYYETYNSNPHRGAYILSAKTTELYEAVREQTAGFINAKRSSEIVFTKGTTEALNLAASSYGMQAVEKGDEIVLSIAEHHSNLIPWQQVAKAKGAKLKYLYTDKEGRIAKEDIQSAIGLKTKIVAITHVSNVLGRINPIEYIVKKAHEANAVVVLDAAQSIPHLPIDVQKLDVDFMAFSGHKMLAPAGVGVLYGKQKYLKQMPPLLFGGGMIDDVSEETAIFAEVPTKFEGGTQNVEGVIGLGAAIEYIQSIGYDKIHEIENQLVDYTLEKLNKNPHITIYGGEKGTDRTGIITFNIAGVHAHDVSTVLDAYGIAIRAGRHCAYPLTKYLGVKATCRMSMYFYNTCEDIDRMIEALANVRRWLRLEP